LAVAGYSNTLATLLGNGDGTFQSPVIEGLGLSPVSIAAGDFNSDGKPDVASASNGGESVSVLLNVISNAAPATISGQITTANGTPVSGITVTLAGTQSGTALTDANGNYTFINLAAGGTYTVIPTYTFHRFDPRGQTFNNLTGNQRGDFVATLQSFSIAGRVTDTDGSAMGGVTVSLSGSQSGTAVTNSTGTYSFFNLAPGGNYTVTVSSPSRTFSTPSRTFNNLSDHMVTDFRAIPGPTMQLSASVYVIGEAGGSAQVVVNRTDSTSAASVNYATSDTFPISQNCQTLNTGIASSRCDYATSIGTLRFAAGEASKTIFIPIVDDNLADGNETFTLTLSNPSGASLGTITTATVTITDNANTPGNPIDEAAFFIREHYIDFLGREPEPAGLAGWLDIYNNCGTTVAQPCDRIEISSAFFRSEEFQNRAYFIYRFYSAVGKIPLYEQFMPDFAKVSGFLSAQELEANKVAFVTEFMARPDYQNLYGSITDNDAYVTALLNTLGLPNHSRKAEWVNALNGGTTRAQVLRAVTEDGQVYTKYYNEAFVIMQYFGYLRRSADISYLQWIQTMNSNGGDYRQMINGFLNSAEYRQRFGQ
jgi:Carboxypeptidase regulatory-like domain/Calx-beta domain/FG-GAP-like repeat